MGIVDKIFNKEQIEAARVFAASRPLLVPQGDESFSTSYFSFNTGPGTDYPKMKEQLDVLGVKYEERNNPGRSSRVFLFFDKEQTTALKAETAKVSTPKAAEPALAAAVPSLTA